MSYMPIHQRLETQPAVMGNISEEESSFRLEASCHLHDEASGTKTFAISEMGDDELAQIRQRRMAEMQAMQVGPLGHRLNNIHQFCCAGRLDVNYQSGSIKII